MNNYPDLLIVLSMAGGVIFGWEEAALIVAGKTLNKVALTILRVLLALLVIALTPASEDGLTLVQVAMLLVMMMGFWAPTHRLILNARRIDLGHRIPMTRLGEGPYDTLWVTLLMRNERAAFITMSAFELVLACAMYVQLQN